MKIEINVPGKWDKPMLSAIIGHAWPKVQRHWMQTTAGLDKVVISVQNPHWLGAGPGAKLMNDPYLLVTFTITEHGE